MLILYGFAAVTVLAFAGGWVLARRASKQDEEQIRVVRTQATLRDWQLDAEPMEYRYSGRTEGISWTFHSARLRGQTWPARAQQLVKPARWKTTAVTLAEGALVIWPSRGSAPAQMPVNAPQMVINLALRPLMSALGARPEDAAVLANANQTVEEPALANFLLRATDPARMRTFLDAGALEALQAADPWLNEADSPLRFIVIVLWHHGLQIVTATAINNPDQIARLARLGATLARAGGGLN
jgi:hypothetical protein